MKRAAALLALPAIGWLSLTALTVAGLLGVEVRRPRFESAGIAFAVGVVLLLALQRRAVPVCVRQPDPTRLFVFAVPAAAAIAAFAWSLELGPLSDDYVLRRWASSGDWAPAEWTYLRPLPLALWNLVTASAGGWSALHAINLLAHALNSALVARLAASWIGPRGGLAAGLVFALFPASTEAVAWNAGVFDLLATTFVLLAAAVWVRPRPSPPRAACLALLCLAGLLSKESALALPAILALIAAFTMSAGEARRRALPFAATVLLGVGFLTMRLASSSALAEHLDKVPASRGQWKDLLVRPFAALAVPTRADAGIGPEAGVAGLAVLVLVGAALVHLARGSRTDTEPPGTGAAAALTVGIGWIVVGSLPLLTQFHVGANLEGSRYLYLPSVGFALALSSAFAGWRRSPHNAVPAVALAALLGTFGLGLSTERSVWLEAARTRDALLGDAAAARAASCRILSVLDPPDSFRGAYVFRQGLPDALAALPFDPAGTACVFRWDGSELVRLER